MNLLDLKFWFITKIYNSGFNQEMNDKKTIENGSKANRDEN